MAHVTGFTLSRVLSIWMDGKIDKYKEYSQFIITKGDENAKRIIKEDNWKITSDILWKIALTLLGVIITILVKPTIEKWL
jgi:hypothetical protein